MLEEDNNATGIPREQHPHDVPPLPSLRGIRSIPRIRRDRGELYGFDLDHDALTDIREMSRRIRDLRQSQAELLYPMYRAGVSVYVLSRMTGIPKRAITNLIRQSSQLDPGEIPMPDAAGDDIHDDEGPIYGDV